MLEKIIIITGQISSGKSTLAGNLGIPVFKTLDVIKRNVESRHESGRIAFQEEGERLDRTTHGKWVTSELQEWLEDRSDLTEVIIDSVRISQQIDSLRKAFDPHIVHIHLTAPLQELKHRFDKRTLYRDEGVKSHKDAIKNKTERQTESLAEMADVVIDTKRCTPQDVLVRARSHLGVRCGKGAGYVDVIIGGQYGSEGKGQIAAFLSEEYDLLVRVGGPNAGHTVYEEPKSYTHHQLPSGTRRSQANLLIGPGATINTEKLLTEIAQCGVEAKRLTIDPQAMIISNKDISKEQMGVKEIGSTGQGGGAAMARRIMGRFDERPPILARDVRELRSFIGYSVDVLERAYADGKRIMLEGTQGTGLSIYHGSYPHVTARDTSVGGCLAEAGIAHNRVRRVIMVCRTYPIRVQSPKGRTSGRMSQELTWKEVSTRSGISEAELKKAERTSTTNRPRRVSEFDWELLKRSSVLNGPTDIALTFTDYLTKKNREAKRFDQLSRKTIDFIEEVERVSGAGASLIATGFNYRSIIDRRLWRQP